MVLQTSTDTGMQRWQHGACHDSLQWLVSVWAMSVWVCMAEKIETSIQGQPALCKGQGNGRGKGKGRGRARHVGQGQLQGRCRSGQGALGGRGQGKGRHKYDPCNLVPALLCGFFPSAWSGSCAMCHAAPQKLHSRLARGQPATPQAHSLTLAHAYW